MIVNSKMIGVTFLSYEGRDIIFYLQIGDIWIRKESEDMIINNKLLGITLYYCPGTPNIIEHIWFLHNDSIFYTETPRSCKESGKSIGIWNREQYIGIRNREQYNYYVQSCSQIINEKQFEDIMNMKVCDTNIRRII